MISLIQICDYGDFVDGQCLTTTTPSPETTTTAMVEDIGELIFIICDADDEMAHHADIDDDHDMTAIMMENQTTATHSRQCYLTIDS